jgi:ABC-type transporter lipoprotein component MlaA
LPAKLKKVRDLKTESAGDRVLLAIIVAFLCFSTAVRGQPAAANGTIVLPASVPDPIEPVNRVLWGFDKGLMTGVIKPTAKVYRSVVVKPVRTGLANVGYNLNYPDRLFNNLLQGRWTGARDETYRFLYNTFAGGIGFFDVAKRIPRSDANFGQTFGLWGWNPHLFLMLPIYGPSDERDTLGLALDSASNPLLYVSPYKFDVNAPATYLSPYAYFTYFVMYNDLSDSVNELVRFSQAEMDPYAELQYTSTFVHMTRKPDLKLKGPRDEASLETLLSIFLTPQDPNFLGRAKTRSVLIPATHRKLKFTYWLRPGRAPVVYIVPGLGSHRLEETSVVLAELVYNHGFSAVNISSPFNSEFMDHASTAALPAYLPVDGRDVQNALAAIDRRLNAEYPGRLAGKALMGYSMGAVDALYAASSEAANRPPIEFDRYVAIDTPVELLRGISKLDEFYRAPLAWPLAERTADIENAFLKVAAVGQHKPDPHAALPFSGVESKFLVGLAFRFMLRDIIYDSQRRHNLGVLHQPIRGLRREPLYQEILQYSYDDYFEKFAIPYYESLGIAARTGQALAKAGDLRTYEGGLRANHKIHVIVNQNDFLLSDGDLDWLRAAFGDRLAVFPKGGHLGNLADPDVQKAILGTLDDLKDAR